MLRLTSTNGSAALGKIDFRFGSPHQVELRHPCLLTPKVLSVTDENQNRLSSCKIYPFVCRLLYLRVAAHAQKLEKETIERYGRKLATSKENEKRGLPRGDGR